MRARLKLGRSRTPNAAFFRRQVPKLCSQSGLR